MENTIKTCHTCGCDNTIVVTPFVDNPRKWTIYRKNGMEVTFEVSDELTLKKISHELTPLERKYIFNHIIPNFRS